MPCFKKINNISEIHTNPLWVDSNKFASKERVVDENGKVLAATYNGRRYQLIAKKERYFSCLERSGRIFLALVATLSSLGLALFSNKVRKFFTKSKKTERFGILLKQPSLPHSGGQPNRKKLPQIPHLDTIHCDNYDSAALKAKQDTIDARQIPLHVCPKKPTRSIPIDQEKAQSYADHLPPPYKDAWEKAASAIRHISMKEFDDELLKCVQKFNGMIGNQDYSVGFTAGKSSQWVASLALKDLTHLPTSWFSLGWLNTNVATYYMHIPNQELILPSNNNHPLVIFDDCGYSGTQFLELLNKISNKIKELNLPKKKLYFIVPFLTEIAEKKITQDFNNKNLLDITLITSEKKIPLINNNLDINQKHLVSKLVQNIYFSQGLTFCYTDWRIPDGVSFPSALGNYYMRKIVDSHDAECHGCALCNLSPSEYFLPSPRDVPRPYAFSKEDLSPND